MWTEPTKIPLNELCSHDAGVFQISDCNQIICPVLNPYDCGAKVAANTAKQHNVSVLRAVQRTSRFLLPSPRADDRWHRPFRLYVLAQK